MVIQLNSRGSQEQVFRFRGNQPMLLNQPETMWVIQSGSVDLFAVIVGQGGIEGNRRYLFSANSGDVLFGKVPDAEKCDRQILAVPIEETELLKIQ